MSVLTQNSRGHKIQTPGLLSKGQPFRQWKTWRIPGTNLTLTGYSRAFDKTFFHIPELKLCLDAGLCEGRQEETVFLTHTHHDHVADIEYLAGRGQGATLYVPEQARDYVEKYIRAKRELNHMSGYNEELAAPYTLKGVRGQNEFEFGKKNQYHVRVVQCIHRVFSVGYCVSEKKTRLKAEYIKMKTELEKAGRLKEFGNKIGELRKQGAVLEEEYSQPLFAFMGDTRPSVFKRNPWVLDYPVVITECTFLNEEDIALAHEAGHTHWTALKPFIEANPDTTFVLIHFSLRHSDSQVLEFFNVQNKDGRYNNIIPWCHNESALPEQHQSSGKQ